MSVCAFQSTRVAVKGQLEQTGSLLPPCEFLGIELKVFRLAASALPH